MKKTELIKHVWSIICDSTIVGQNNNVSLVNVVEQININLPPVSNGKTIRIPYQFELITLWQREADVEKKILADSRIRFVDWKNNVLMQGEYKLELPQGKKRGRAISKFPGVEIKGLGNYRFLIELKEFGKSDFEIVGEIPLEIRHISVNPTV